MKLLDPHHSFYRPLGVRLGITTFCLAWAVFELTTQAYVWAIIFGAMGLMCAYEFFINKNNNFSASDESNSHDEPKP